MVFQDKLESALFVSSSVVKILCEADTERTSISHMNKVLLSLSDYQIVNPVNAEITGCQKKVLSSHYLTFLSIVKQLCTQLPVNGFLLDFFF